MPKPIDQEKESRALFNWFLDEGQYCGAQSIEVHLGNQRLELNEWYISEGRIIIDVRLPRENARAQGDGTPENEL